MYDSANNAPPVCGSTRFVTRADLVRSAGLLGAAYTFNNSAPADEEVLHGQFDTLQLRPGLILHAACVRDLHTMNTSNHLNPGIKIVLLVDGATDLSFGHHRFHLGPATADPRQRSAGALVNLAEQEMFSRRWLAGRSERKVSLTLTPEWLENGGLQGHAAHGALQSFHGEHLARQPWTVTPRARELARQILAPQALMPGLQRLRLEARCIELAAEALAAVGAQQATAAAKPALRELDLRRLARLEELLRSSCGADLSMQGIARELGTNPVSLQALTRRAWGVTVFERVRQLRMQRAHALLQGGASVAQAADAAGYSAACNFSTAYRRHYGSRPRDARLGDNAAA
ncbi:hypothetical protein ASD15_09540 [Massilia sp. Root351]|jgi:AraC-like DNA-binding protein|uniref:helix-turn-helix transcriptional regulator n=1 Tax=Massilia sp. Root351 TaxID=1736522 RepID=UPI00070C1A22|nr:AraC family transcriptional regulator [Massilia sp. Root351]KQV82284.1 hypothetical protein ASD15_09540 [Massilia sp. Root351]